MTICPVCQSAAERIVLPAGRDATGYSCPGCGEFEITGTALATLPHQLETMNGAQAKLRHWLRKAQDAASRPVLDSRLMDEIISNATIPGAMEQANQFLLWLGRNSAYPGHELEVPLILATAIMGAPTIDGYSYILDHLTAEGLVDDRSPKVLGPPRGFKGTLTVRGWDRFTEVEQHAVNSQVIFMAMKYRDPLLDRAFNDCFRPAVAKTGLRLRRLDDHPKAGLIDNRLRLEIRESVMLIADLTYNNSGAYWEAGYAEGLGRPVLYTCFEDFFHKTGDFVESGGTHFDTNHCLTILWSPDTFDRAADELKAAIRLTLPTITKATDD